MYALYLPALFGSASPCGSWQSTHFGVNSQVASVGVTTLALWWLAWDGRWQLAVQSALGSEFFSLNGFVPVPCATAESWQVVQSTIALPAAFTLIAPVWFENLYLPSLPWPTEVYCLMFTMALVPLL